MRTKYRCKICRQEFVVNLLDTQSYLKQNCPHCQSGWEYHHNLSSGKPENFVRTFRQYLYLNRYMENMVFPYWDSCVRIIGEDKAKRMIKKEEEDYTEMIKKEKVRYEKR